MSSDKRVRRCFRRTTRSAAIWPTCVTLLLVACLTILAAADSVCAQSSSWESVGTGDCPGRDVSSSPGPTPDPAKCDAAFAGFTAVCWSGACTYKNVLTASCTGGANPGRMYRCVLGPPLSPAGSGWESVGTGDCPGRDVASSTGPAPDPAKCNAAFDGFTAVCWSGACTYKNVVTASCTGGANPGRMYRCRSASTPGSGRWKAVGIGDCPGRDVSSSSSSTPEPAKCNAGFNGFTAVCWASGCTYKNVLTAECTGGAHPGNMYRCEAAREISEVKPREIEVAPNATPEITQVRPSQAAPGAVVTVTVEGRNFAPGVIVSTNSAAVRTGSTRWVSQTQFEVSLTVSQSVPAGTVSLYVSNPASRAAEAPFTITAAPSSASAPASAPATAVDLGTVWTVVDGTGWFGTWTRRAGTNVFDAVWKNRAGQVIRDTLQLQPVVGNKVSLYRVGIKGQYTGTLAADGRHITGTASWFKPGETWSATINLGGAVAESILGEWQIYRGGPVGTADENKPTSSGMLVIWDDNGTYRGRLAFARRERWENLADFTFNNGVLTFTRPPSRRRPDPQQYRAVISGDKLAGTCTQGSQTQKWWGAKTSRAR